MRQGAWSWFAMLALATEVVACGTSDSSSGPTADSGAAANSGSGGRSGAGGATSGGSGGSGGSEGGGASNNGGVSSSNGGASAGGGVSSSNGGVSSSGGAGAGDAGGKRAFSTNRDDFFGDSRCAAAGVLFCDDFEGAAIDTGKWSNKGTAPVLDTVRFARGKKSLHMSTTATGFSGLQTSKIFPAVGNTYYGRLFVYFDALPTSPQWAHWTIVGANPKSTDAASVKGEIRVGGQYDGKLNRFGVGTDGGPTGDWTNLDGDPAGAVKAAPEKSWVCIEWMHKGDTNETRFWWDGVEHPSLDTTRDVKHGGNAGVKFDLPTFDSVWVGFWNYDQGQAVTPNHFDTWIDEVALDDERIGCDI